MRITALFALLLLTAMLHTGPALAQNSAKDQTQRYMDLSRAELTADQWAAFIEDPYPLIRSMAYLKMARTKDPRIVQPLIRDLTESAGGGQRFPPQKHMLLGIMDVHITRANLAMAAMSAPNPEYIPALEHLVDKERNVEIAEFYRDALHACRLAAGRVPAATNAVALDIATLKDPEKRAIAVAVATPQSLLKALAVAIAANDEQAVHGVQREIFRRPEADVIEEARRASESHDPIMRAAAATALARALHPAFAQAEGTAARDLLRRLAADPESVVALAVLDAIGRRVHSADEAGYFAELKSSQALARHPQAAVRRQYVAQTFAKVGARDNSDLQALMQYLRDPSEDVRSTACHMLIGVVSVDTEPTVRSSIRDATLETATDMQWPANLRRLAMRLLAQIRDAAVVPLVVKELSSVGKLNSDLIEEFQELVISSATLYPHPSYVPGLLKYRELFTVLVYDTAEVSALIETSRTARP